MKRTLVISSLVLNVVLIGVLVWFYVGARERSFELMAEATEAEVRLQEHILAQLEAEPPEIEGLKQLLRRNIANGAEISTVWRDAAN
ncbi:MAG: hypothetical protein ACYS15_05950 [Planctomycetota bacterium]|jgi:uncharacterized membrane protein